MISRNYLKCTTCEASTTTRTAIGHDDYQEFAFPCHRCGVEIRFGMALDQKNASFDYTKIVNAVWSDVDPSAPAIVFDGENLNPLNPHPIISPFIETVNLPQDVDKFRADQGARYFAVKRFWPSLEKLVTHHDRDQADFFDEEYAKLGYKHLPTNRRERTVSLLTAFDNYGSLFGPPNTITRNKVFSRIQLAEKTATTAIRDVVAHFRAKGRQTSLAAELHRTRQQWVRLFGCLASVYNVYYWDEAKHSLDAYTVGQKRFDELKPFYVDCFETFCRISCIAAALEGVIKTSKAIVPSKKGMPIGDFEAQPNGSKSDVLKNTEIADLFVPFVDSHLRNGIGHNAAHYDVGKDVVCYANQNDKGKVEYTVPYVRFCERVVRLYGQLETVAIYANWLVVKCA
jgi:hypothetical protein